MSDYYQLHSQECVPHLNCPWPSQSWLVLQCASSLRSPQSSSPSQVHSEETHSLLWHWNWSAVQFW